MEQVEVKRSYTHKAGADGNNHQQGLPSSHQYTDPSDQGRYSHDMKPRSYGLHSSPPSSFTCGMGLLGSMAALLAGEA